MKSVIEPSEMHGADIEPNSENDIPLNRKQALEIIWPYVFGAVAASLFATGFKRFGVPPGLHEVFGAVAGTAGVFAGFMLAAAAILASIGDKSFIRDAKRAGLYGSLIRNLFTAMRWSIGTTVISLPAMLFDPLWNLPWYPYALWAWSFVALTALGTSVRALRTFAKVMDYVSAE